MMRRRIGIEQRRNMRSRQIGNTSTSLGISQHSIGRVKFNLISGIQASKFENIKKRKTLEHFRKGYAGTPWAFIQKVKRKQDDDVEKNWIKKTTHPLDTTQTHYSRGFWE